MLKLKLDYPHPVDSYSNSMRQAHVYCWYIRWTRASWISLAQVQVAAAAAPQVAVNIYRPVVRRALSGRSGSLAAFWTCEQHTLLLATDYRWATTLTSVAAPSPSFASHQHCPPHHFIRPLSNPHYLTIYWRSLSYLLSIRPLLQVTFLTLCACLSS